AGSSTSSQPPADSRSDLPSGAPSRATRPAAARSAARERLSPNNRARATSTRSPSSPSGTGSARSSPPVLLTLLTGWRLPVARAPVDRDVAQRQQHDHQARQADVGVRQVEDRPAGDVDEIHHVPAERAGGPGQPVAEVAQRATQQQPQG